MKILPMNSASFLTCLATIVIGSLAGGPCAGMVADSLPTPRKLHDIVIYQDARFHAAFPSVVRRPDGDIIVAFRRAPNRNIFGEAKTNHTDPNSYLVTVRSKDGVNWQKEPSLLYAHAFGGSQDPCMLQL